jgi:hypothetical protein
MGTSEDNPWLIGSTPVPRELERASRRARIPQVRVHDADQFRRDLLQHVDTLGAFDATDAERAETAEWRHRITDAPADRLWVEYQLLTGHRPGHQL